RLAGPEPGSTGPAAAPPEARSAPEPPPARGSGEEIIALIPALRVFARSLCRDRVEADDLVQETLLRAIENIGRFQPGPNLRAWLVTILRNRVYTGRAKRKRERKGHADHVTSLPATPTESQR